ncbi:MAG: glutamyl-tRNA reductase [Pirellulaceae bacterium]
MQVQLVGCSHHRAPLAIRERFSWGPEQIRYSLGRLRKRFPQLEVVLLSTCNRVELYTATERDDVPPAAEIAAALAAEQQADPQEVMAHLYGLHGRDAIRHLFLVASSLDSMVLGETQISAQVKHAYQTATEQEATGPVTHAVFQRAAQVARRVATETAIHKRRVSIPSVAIADFARQVFERFDDKRTLVIGAGEMAEETLRYLCDFGVTDITIVNRTCQTARSLAERHGGRARPWEDLLRALAAADLVVSTTGAGHPIVTAEDFAPVHALRAGRPVLILDLAVPRDFDVLIGRFSEVFLYSVDDLRAVCRQNAVERERELPKAIRIIDAETDRFMVDIHFTAAKPIVSQLMDAYSRSKESELQRLFKKLSHLDEGMQVEIRRSFDRLTNKMMHRPLASLRAGSRDGVPVGLLEAVTQLFRFKP